MKNISQDQDKLAIFLEDMALIFDLLARWDYEDQLKAKKIKPNKPYKIPASQNVTRITR